MKERTMNNKNGQGMIPSGVVAITGAGAGLGQGLAAECARRGMHVLGLIQNDGQRAALEAATKGLAGKVDIQVLDVTQVGDFAFPADIEVLVNNAGIRLKTLPVEEIPLGEWRLYFEVNFFGAVELTRRAIPIMRQRHRGVICNINSASICMPLPFHCEEGGRMRYGTCAGSDATIEAWRTGGGEPLMATFIEKLLP